MPSAIQSGMYVYYYDFPNELDPEFIPLPPEETYPMITSDEDQYSLESTRFSDYLNQIKMERDCKIAWTVGAVPAALDSLEEWISLRQLCDYLNTSDYWKKGGDWPEFESDEQIRAFNIEVVRGWLFQKAGQHFYHLNPDALPSFNKYRMQLELCLEQIKNELLALNTLYLIQHHLDSYLDGLFGSLNLSKQLDKYNILKISVISEMIKEKELFPDLQLYINPNDFAYWQQTHKRLIPQLVVIINQCFIEELKKKCEALGSKVSFEQLYQTHWPTSRTLEDNNPPLRSLSEANEFLDRIASTVQQRLRLIEEKKKGWKGSLSGFDVAIERVHALVGSKEISDEDFMQKVSEQLKKVAAEDEVIESLSLVNKNPIEIVTKMLEKERVDDVAAIAPIIVRDIQQVIEHMPDKPTLTDSSKNIQALDEFVVNVRSACNRAALIDLYDRLERSTNKQIAEKMIENWDIIGTDIRDSERMMTESDKLRILAYAEGKKTKKDYEEEMAKLNVKLERGEISPQEEVVIKIFPKLKKALTRLPKEYFEDFSLVLKKAFVNQQITHPEKFMQDPNEAAVFTALGLNPSKIKENKEAVQHKIKHVIQNAVLNGQKEEEFPTLKELQQQIELLAVKEKVIAAGGEPSLAPTIVAITKARQEILTTTAKLLEEEYEQCKKELTETNERIAQHIDSSLKIRKVD